MQNWYDVTWSIEFSWWTLLSRPEDAPTLDEHRPCTRQNGICSSCRALCLISSTRSPSIDSKIQQVVSFWYDRKMSDDENPCSSLLFARCFSVLSWPTTTCLSRATIIPAFYNYTILSSSQPCLPHRKGANFLTALVQHPHCVSAAAEMFVRGISLNTSSAVRAQIDPLANEVNTMVENIARVESRQAKGDFAHETSTMADRHADCWWNLRGKVDGSREFRQTNEEKFREFRSNRCQRWWQSRWDQTAGRRWRRDRIDPIAKKSIEPENGVRVFEKGFSWWWMQQLWQEDWYMSHRTSSSHHQIQLDQLHRAQNQREQRSNFCEFMFSTINRLLCFLEQNVVPPVTPQAQNPPPPNQQPPNFLLVLMNSNDKPSNLFEVLARSLLNPQPQVHRFPPSNRLALHRQRLLLSHSVPTLQRQLPIRLVINRETTTTFGVWCCTYNVNYSAVWFGNKDFDECEFDSFGTSWFWKTPRKNWRSSSTKSKIKHANFDPILNSGDDTFLRLSSFPRNENHVMLTKTRFSR